MDDNHFIDIKKFLKWIKQCQRFDRYKWYKQDVYRKRPNRKKGRDLYHGILAYRRRVGQREDRLNFRGVARIYDVLRIRAIRQHPELAEKIPDLYMRFLSLRFSPSEFEAKICAKPLVRAKPVMTQLYNDIDAMMTRVPPMVRVVPDRDFYLPMEDFYDGGGWTSNNVIYGARLNPPDGLIKED